MSKRKQKAKIKKEKAKRKDLEKSFVALAGCVDLIRDRMQELEYQFAALNPKRESIHDGAAIDSEKQLPKEQLEY